MEWGMFDKVNDVSGRADCQDDRETFDIMRRSQFDAWNEDVLLSYLGDLEEALAEGRNILTEKYAYMMEYTAPLEFREIKDLLPPVSDEKRILARRITDMCMAAYDEIAGAYPLVVSRGRPQYRASEEDGYPSVETYMLGEFSTWSPRTLNKYLEYLLRLRDSGVNISRVILENSMKRYGFASLDDAEARLRTEAY
jgi:ribosomal protein S18